jgi:ribosomal protein S18 acetylase RimI-like enzyme
MSAVEISVREASIEDVDVLAHIGASSFREAYEDHSEANDLENHIEKYFTVAAVRNEIEQHGRRYRLAFVDGAPAGLAKIRKAACPVPGGDANAVELQQLYVLATMQRHGLGRRLMADVVAFAEKNAAAGVWLSAWENADWATRFYERNGFAAIGKVDFKLGTTTHTDLLMWRPLE